ncbi:PD-(D/E)XK nuclease family protein [Candidatus Woesearchaeota archaeon]|nr:PD-(D/E)XK nuclease family protein [Candidatus Woesearchaeota archaeon]
MTRIQSPSSINTYNQCPRKYYYHYIEKLETKPSIHLIRGNIMHSVLEDFFKVDSKNLSKDHYDFELRTIAHELLRKWWNEKKGKLDSLELGNAKLEFYLRESRNMLDNWLNLFLDKLKKEGGLVGFKKLTPETEVYFESTEHMVRGYVDAIHIIDGKINIIDYKTSKSDELRDEYKLQLAIYALMYHEKHGKMPHKVGVDFLRHGEKFIDVNQALLDLAKKETALIQENTKSIEKEDYKLNPSRLCNWCDFYGLCFNNDKVYK